MFTLVEITALTSVVAFGLFLLRNYLRKASAVALLFASFLLLTALAGPAFASDFRKSESVQIRKDEVIKGDLFAASESIRVDGTVDGDVFAAGKQVEVSGHVTGDVLCACQSLRISGQVDGNVRNASNNLTITGSVGRAVTTFTETTVLDSSAKIGHSLTVFSKSLTLDGTVGGDLLAFAAETTVDGAIAGELRAQGDSLSVGSSASVGGKAVFKGNKPAEVASGAKLAFPVEFRQIEHRSRTERGVGYYIWKVVWAGAWILFGLVLISLMPVFAKETVQSAEQYGASLGLGVLVFFGVFISAWIACFTIVGLLLGISALFLWTVTLFSSYVVVGTVIGRWILGKENELWPLVGRMALGVLIVKVGTAIPHLGFWVMLAVWFWGLGAVSLAVYRRLQPNIAAGAPPPAPYAPQGGSPLPPNTTVGGV